MNIFGNRPQASSNIFSGGNNNNNSAVQGQVRSNIFGGGGVGGGNTGGSNIFSGGNSAAGGSNIFSGGASGGNIFNQGQQQQQQGGNIFGGNNQQQQQPGSNIFSNNNNQGQQQQGSNIFSNNQQQPQYNQGNIFNNQGQGNYGQPQQPQGSNIFNNQQQQQQPQGNNIFSNNYNYNNYNNQQQQQQQPNNVYGNNYNNNSNTGNIFNNTNQVGAGTNSSNLLSQTQSQIRPQLQLGLNSGLNSSSAESETIRLHLEEYSKRIDPRNLDHIRIDEMNIFKDKKIGDLPDKVKESILVLMNNMKELKEAVDIIKKQNQELDTKSAQFCKAIHQKLTKYKECLIQSISQSNMIDEIREEIDSMDTQISSFLIPLYNAHKTGKQFPFQSPDEFNINVSRKVLERMIELDKKADQLVACVQGQGQAELSAQQANTLDVLEQLLEYYDKIAAKVLEFSNKYSQLRRQRIDQARRSTSYEDVMRRIQDKVDAKLKKDFKGYDLIKEVEQILVKREKRQEEILKEQKINRRQQYAHQQSSYY